MLFAAWGCTGSNSTPDTIGGEERTHRVELNASDGVKVHGSLYLPKDEGKSRVVALMFHQAGSNADEYKDIAPKLVERGISCLAIDQRSGGTMWGRDNQTVRDSGRSDWTYEDAYKDLQAAYAWAVEHKYGRIIVWGSSYSASLALRLASENQVAAVIAFSPGEYFTDKKAVSRWNATVKAPRFFSFTEAEAKNGGYVLYQSLTDTGARHNDVVAHNKDGAHGSSALLRDKSQASSYYWGELWRFLEKLHFVKADTKQD